MRRPTHTVGEVLGMFVLGAVLVGFLVFSIMRDQSGMDARAGSVNTCQAPCVVTFSSTERVYEDEAGIDFSDGKVYVTRIEPR